MKKRSEREDAERAALGDIESERTAGDRRECIVEVLKLSATMAREKIRCVCLRLLLKLKASSQAGNREEMRTFSVSPSKFHIFLSFPISILSFAFLPFWRYAGVRGLD